MVGGKPEIRIQGPERLKQTREKYCHCGHHYRLAINISFNQQIITLKLPPSSVLPSDHIGPHL